MPHAVRTTIATLLLAGTVTAAARPVGPVPALGPLLDPVHGVWANARAGARAGARDEATVAIPGLGAPVRIVYDDRGVPHIFAGREEDAYRALGYVVARDRLLQLYVQTLGASGRVTEVRAAASSVAG